MIRVVMVALFLILASFEGAWASVADATPRLGIDYEILPTPQPTYSKGKIEVAEVFSYGCHFCAQFQPLVNDWRKTIPADVRWEYVPAAFGGSSDTFARAYFAAETLGVREKTHDAVFKAIFVDQAVKSGTPEEVADMYATLGVDRSKFLATMQSFGVTAKLAGAHQFALRTGIAGTPTLILNGKYRINVTRDRSFAGTIATLNFLLAKERL